MGGLTDLQSHPIFDRGCLIGLWEYDAKTESIVWATFGLPPREVADAVRRMQVFVRDELGDCRSFALDKPALRQPRIAALRTLAVEAV